MYDQLWMSLIATPENKQALNDLQFQIERTLRVHSGCSFASAKRNIPRQYNRELEPRETGTSSALKDEETMGFVANLDFERPVLSLDQLYVQASCLHPILLEKVKGWATLSRGMFQIDGTHDHGLLVGSADEGCTHSFKFAKMKSTSRAIEKVVRSYGQAKKISILCLI